MTTPGDSAAPLGTRGESEAGEAQGQLMAATAVALDIGGRFNAVLLRGPSGSGKSDLALRLIDDGGRLVSDDQSELEAREGRLWARAPATIRGLMEVRGLGLVRVPPLAEAPVALLVDLVAGETVERLPEPARESVSGVSLPRLSLSALEPSAVPKIKLALAEALGAAAGRPAEPGAATTSTPDGETAAERSVVVVTGLSGAGHSTALKALEDLGYESVDNLPLSLMGPLLAEAGGPVAVGIDTRTRGFAVDPLIRQLDALSAETGGGLRVLFIDCDDEVLGRRYSETRRRHPLAHDHPVRDGIAAERRLVQPLRERADLVIDTSELAPRDFAHLLAGHFALGAERRLRLAVVSFSYKHGLPREADLVFDVRFLENPHYVEALRPLAGLDPEIVRFVERDPNFVEFFARLEAMLLPLLPRYEREGKTYLTIAIGCTGGRHRSVMVAERLALRLRAADRSVVLVHRDLPRASTPAKA